MYVVMMRHKDFAGTGLSTVEAHGPFYTSDEAEEYMKKAELKLRPHYRFCVSKMTKVQDWSWS